MPKFEDEEDGGFKSVSGELRRWIRYMNNQPSFDFQEAELGVAVL
jgi:hypothetical protein